MAANDWEIMTQDQRAKTAVTWAMVGRVKGGFIDTWLVDKIMGDNYVVGYFPCGALCHGPNEPCIQRTVKNDQTSSLSPRCTVLRYI